MAVEEWSSLVNPECRIPAYIESFTGISNEMVAEAPRFADIAALVLEKLKSPRPDGPARPAPVFVAHNARFDYSFLRAEFRRLDVHFCAQVLCTVKLSRRLFPQHARHSLDAVMERHELGVPRAPPGLGRCPRAQRFLVQAARRAARGRAGRSRAYRAGREPTAGALAARPRGRITRRPGRVPLFRARGRAPLCREKQFPARPRPRSLRRSSTPKRSNGSSDETCGESTGWRPPASLAPHCAKPNGSRRSGLSTTGTSGRPPTALRSGSPSIRVPPNSSPWPTSSRKSSQAAAACFILGSRRARR